MMRKAVGTRRKNKLVPVFFFTYKCSNLERGVKEKTRKKDGQPKKDSPGNTATRISFSSFAAKMFTPDPLSFPRFIALSRFHGFL